MSYDEHGNKIKASGPEGFMVIDFSTFHDVWVNVGTDEEALEETQGSWSELFQKLPPEDETPKIPEAWRDKAFDIDVQRAIRQMDVVEEARELRDKRNLPPFLEPSPKRARDLLAEPDSDIRYKVHDLWPHEGNVLFAAAAKFGKSTTIMNLIRSLLEGTAFLGAFEVERVRQGESILLIDFEMSEDRVRREIRGQKIDDDNVDPLIIENLRGEAGRFDIRDQRTRDWWVAYCRQNNVTTLILDPLAPLLGYMGVDENDNNLVNQFFQQLDEFKKDAGVRDMLVAHHCGHSADMRPRGASRFNDWPDALWLAKIDDPTDPQSDRKFYARGRDVGETMMAPGKIERDQSNDKRLLYSAQGAAVSNAEAELRGVILNEVQARQGTTLDSEPAERAGGERMLPKIAARFGRGELPSWQAAPNKGQVQKVIKSMITDQELCGAEHKFQTPGGSSKPIAYYTPDVCPCTRT